MVMKNKWEAYKTLFDVDSDTFNSKVLMENNLIY